MSQTKAQPQTKPQPQPDLKTALFDIVGKAHNEIQDLTAHWDEDIAETLSDADKQQLERCLSAVVSQTNAIRQSVTGHTTLLSIGETNRISVMNLINAIEPRRLSPDVLQTLMADLVATTELDLVPIAFLDVFFACRSLGRKLDGEVTVSNDK